MGLRTWLWWSSGKDAAWALHRLRDRDDIEVVGLVTTISDVFDRISGHAVRTGILREQAGRLRLPLHEVRLPHPCSNRAYEAAIAPLLARAGTVGVDAMAFGDIFLDDVRAYRETMLEGSGLRAIFPLWGSDTGALAREMIEGGVEAVVTCIDPSALDDGWAGRTFDAGFLADLPPEVDPCGENGEFHTCVTAGPFFTHPIELEAGPAVEREGFVFADFELACASGGSGPQGTDTGRS